MNELMGSVCGNTGFFGISFNKTKCQYARFVMYSALKVWTSLEETA
jgi:hypothetical protein